MGKELEAFDEEEETIWQQVVLGEQQNLKVCLPTWSQYLMSNVLLKVSVIMQLHLRCLHVMLHFSVSPHL